MVDRVRAVKQESTATGGKDSDQGVYGSPRPLNPNDDGLDQRAVFLQNNSSTDSNVTISRDASNNMTFADGVVAGTKTLTDLLSATGITASEHLALDQLVHDLDEDYYEEYTYTGWKVTNVTVWTDSGKTLKIREYDFTWSGVKITQEVRKQYDGVGTLAETLTLVYAYTGNKISTITCTRS